MTVEALRACVNPECLRKLGGSAAYCCAACADADDGRFEIHAHTGQCDATAAQRGEWSAVEAAARRLAEAPSPPLAPWPERTPPVAPRPDEVTS